MSDIKKLTMLLLREEISRVIERAGPVTTGGHSGKVNVYGGGGGLHLKAQKIHQKFTKDNPWGNPPPLPLIIKFLEKMREIWISKWMSSGAPEGAKRLAKKRLHKLDFTTEDLTHFPVEDFVEAIGSLPQKQIASRPSQRTRKPGARGIFQGVLDSVADTFGMEPGEDETYIDPKTGKILYDELAVVTRNKDILLRHMYDAFSQILENEGMISTPPESAEAGDESGIDVEGPDVSEFYGNLPLDDEGNPVMNPLFTQSQLRQVSRRFKDAMWNYSDEFLDAGIAGEIADFFIPI